MNQHRINIKLLTLLSLTGLLFFSQFSLADSAYTWKDENGRVFVGSRVPKGAKAVKKLKTSPISRYSSSKVLKGYGNSGGRRAKSIRARLNYSAPKNNKTHKKAKTTPAHQNPDVEPTNIHQPQPLNQEAKLLHQDLKIKQNSDGTIKSCEVSVQNVTDTPANNVVVSFEFSDGTLVPAYGPQEAPARSIQTYRIPDNLFPLLVKPEKNGKIAPPEVRVQFD